MIRRVLANVIGRPLGLLLGSLYFLLLYTWNSTWRDPRHLYLEGVGTVKWYCRSTFLGRHVNAITFGRRVFCRTPSPWFDLVRHEHVHVQQYERRGWIGFLMRYGYEVIRYGYRNAPLELEAYRG